MNEPKPHPTTFKVGDVIECTSPFWRKDKKSRWNPGEKATVSMVSNTTGTQIIAIEIPNRLPMHDIVCFEHTPIRLA